MSHTYTQNHLHVVFSTKERKKIIQKSFQAKLWSYIAGVARNDGFLVIANGGMEDHVHLLIQLPAKLALAEPVATIKANSSRWVNEHASMVSSKFSWQEGYGAFSVSASKLATVTCYIEN